MTPESADYLAKARECLDAAKATNAIPLPQVAAKEACPAAYPAAHALVFESTGRSVKSHSGMRTTFAQIAKADPAWHSATRPTVRRSGRQESRMRSRQ